MAPPPLTPTLRYFPPGTRKTYWMPTTANYLNPTRAEINAGTDLSAEVSAMTGWSLTSAAIDVPDMGSRFTSQIPGRLTSQSNDMTFYISSNGNDARRLMPRDTNGYIIQLWEGDNSGGFMDVFPVRVMAQAMDSTIEDPGKCVISFAITRVPAIQITIP